MWDSNQHESILRSMFNPHGHKYSILNWPKAVRNIANFNDCAKKLATIKYRQEWALGM